MAKPRKLKSKLKQQEFYCVERRRRVKCHADDIRIRKDRRGRPRMVCKSPNGHKMYKYIKLKDEKRLRKKYN